MEIDRKEIDRAIARGEFVPYFQPIVHLRTGELHGFELLARWHHRRSGWIAPTEFIPAAERDGWIDAMTHTLLRQAFHALAKTSCSANLSINISPVQLYDRTLPDQIAALAAECNFRLERITVEITETALANDLERARETVTALQDKGCQLALDDFGTGYSSLTQLHSLPFNELKVDRSFVSTMMERRDSRKIVAAVVGLGQSLGLTTVAEGVETHEQAEKLRWMGCDLAQGWLFGQPLPAHSLAEAANRTWSGATVVSTSEMRGSSSRGSLDWLPSQRLAHLQAIYDGAPVGLAFLDCEMRYVYLNRRLANMNGRPMLEHLGRTVKEMLPELFPEVAPYIRRALSGESITGVEVEKPKEGPNAGRRILLSYEPARDEAGEVIGVSVALIDVPPSQREPEA
ncbi:MAG: EAL domain-containing protein [Terracidiphilus sp.]|nr:EAL domain-containing protein [Terracidiphilus sp.]